MRVSRQPLEELKNTRDFFEEKLRIAHVDVEHEPDLLPLAGETFTLQSAKTKDNDHPDIRTKGFWNRGKSAFFDIKVIYLNAPTHRNTPVLTALRNAEKEKNRFYGQRIRDWYSRASSYRRSQKARIQHRR